MALPQWEVMPGRCGACTRFEKDFGGGSGTVFGHCGRKPRSGSIASSDFKCDVYDPIPEIAPVIRPVAERKKPEIDVFADAEDIVAIAHAAKAGPSRRTRTLKRGRPAVVVRRQSREERDKEEVDFGDGEEGMDRGTLREIIREAIEDSLGIGEVELTDRFKGGTIVVRPGVDGAAEKEIPIDALMRKVVMIRDNLRVLEQKVNQHKKLDDPDKVALQQYITRCYGSLTTFNSLFKHREDWFQGSSR